MRELRPDQCLQPSPNETALGLAKVGLGTLVHRVRNLTAETATEIVMESPDRP